MTAPEPRPERRAALQPTVDLGEGVAGAPDGEGGDAACWLAQVCPECGALREGPAACWRCGAA